MIVYTTDMKEFPKSCIDCPLNCNLPTSYRNPAKLLKPYLTKRHPNCPLRIVKDEHNEEVEK